MWFSWRSRSLESEKTILHVDTFGVMTDRVVVPVALAVAKNLRAVMKNLMTHNLGDVAG